MFGLHYVDRCLDSLPKKKKMYSTLDCIRNGNDDVTAEVMVYTAVTLPF